MMTKQVITILGNREGGELTKVHTGTSRHDYAHGHLQDFFEGWAN